MNSKLLTHTTDTICGNTETTAEPTFGRRTPTCGLKRQTAVAHGCAKMLLKPSVFNLEELTPSLGNRSSTVDCRITTEMPSLRAKVVA